MNLLTGGIDSILTPEFDVWAKEAKDFAEKPEHWIDAANGETARKHVERLRFKHGEEFWTTHMVFWYSVEAAQDGKIYRHISVECSEPNMSENQSKEFKVALKRLLPQLLEFFRPLLAKFWPIHAEMGGQILLHTSVGYKGNGQPIPVQDPESKQFTYRMPFGFHFLVPWEGDVEELAAKYAKAQNVAKTDPRVLGWKPGTAPPVAPTDRWVLAWNPEYFGSPWRVMQCHDTAGWHDGHGPYSQEPIWWRELPDPPKGTP